jgi:hypothetical protein
MVEVEQESLRDLPPGNSARRTGAIAETNRLIGHRQGPGMAGPCEHLNYRLYDRRKSMPEDSPTFKVLKVLSPLPPIASTK